ncbi:MAG TPA: hypothetical protein VJN02_00705 [Gammaproteobacteria bacterium]|nr:hypothetical protein [Gammaproteobacteria bacterium]
MHIYQFRQLAGQEIVDYNLIKNALKRYSHPRGKISEWIRKSELIRVKKGLYIFGQAASQEPYSLEVLANLIYGPSALSLNYALYYYGLIPERVQTITSITNKRNKIFNTPIGCFTYHYLSPEKYAIGIQLLTIGNGINFLIATPEKALCDVVSLTIKGITFKSKQDIERFILDDLRLDETELKKLDNDLIKEISHVYGNTRLNYFVTHYLMWKKIK